MSAYPVLELEGPEDERERALALVMEFGCLGAIESSSEKMRAFFPEDTRLDDLVREIETSLPRLACRLPAPEPERDWLSSFRATLIGFSAVAMWALLAVGLCNSIMFPTSFSMALHRLGVHTAQGSGLLCMAIVGGALLPLAQGHAADVWGLQASFGVPALCYLGIAAYGWVHARLFQR